MRGVRLLLATVLPALLAASELQAAPRPNVVVIMADDLDLGSLDTMLSLGLMPAFQANFVKQGIRFRQSFVTNALCGPSRATFLTGQYPHNHGTLANAGPFGGVTRLRDNSTLATWLHDGGYRTGHIGKYVNGYGSNWILVPNSPLPQFDPRYIPPGWDDWQGLVDPTTYQVYRYVLNDNGTIVHYGNDPEDYQTDVIADRAVNFLLRTPGPFFLSIAPLAPHVEVRGLQGDQWRDAWHWMIRPAPRHEGSVQIGLLPALKPSFNEADFTDKPIWRPPLGTEEIMGRPRTARVGLIEQYRSRLTALRAVDDLVRRVFVTLRLTGRLDNTVVIFVSDNGFLYGEHRLPQKLVAYEESIRVPLYIRVPWNTQPRSEDRIVLNNDLAPTIADLAGVVPGLPTDGRSLAPLLRGETPPDWRRRLLVEHFWNDSILDFATFGAIRNGPADAQSPDALYVEYYDQVTPQQPGDPVPPIMFRELYDLASDPFQLDSLHRDPGRGPQMESLAHVLAALRVCGGLPGQTACPELER